MIAAIVTDESYEILEEINRRKLFELERLAAQTASAAQRQIEKGKQSYEKIVVEVEAIRHGNVEAVIDLIERLQTTTTAKIIVLAQGYDPEGSVIKDIISIGVEQSNVVTSSGLWLKKRVQELLQQSSLAVGTNCPSTVEAAASAAPTPTPTPVAPVPVKAIPEPATKILLEEVQAPAQIDRAAAKKMLLPKPPIAAPATRAIMIAFAGAGNRIGTTTQAMQMFLFLVASGYKAALVEMSDASVLSAYSANPEFCPEHYKVKGLDLFRTRNSLLHVKNAFQYLVLDYGSFTEISDPTSFLEKDYKIICTGVKPQESAELEPVFEADDGSLMYCFSFVPDVDKAEVVELMKGRKVYFSAPTFDYWTYCGEDDTYRALLDLVPNTENKLGGLFKRK